MAGGLGIQRGPSLHTRKTCIIRSEDVAKTIMVSLRQKVRSVNLTYDRVSAGEHLNVKPGLDWRFAVSPLQLAADQSSRHVRGLENVMNGFLVTGRRS